MVADHNTWKAKSIVEAFPRELLEPLLERDGTTMENPYNNRGKGVSRPTWMYALDLVAGAAGSHVTGYDWAEWLTPLGQAIVEEVKSH